MTARQVAPSIIKQLTVAGQQIHQAETCLPCRGYIVKRGHIITAAIARRTLAMEEAAIAYGRLLAGVHERHLAGLSIEVPA